MTRQTKKQRLALLEQELARVCRELQTALTRISLLEARPIPVVLGPLRPSWEEPPIGLPPRMPTPQPPGVVPMTPTYPGGPIWSQNENVLHDGHQVVS